MYEAILIEWAGMAIRWLHVIAGITWIGSSFYFIALDLSLKKRDDLPAGVQGEAWQVHGGGFYNMVKYLVVPARMPDELTWFKWEAYTTWLSGFALLVVVYYLGASLFLIDHAHMPMEPWQAVAVSLAGLILPWLGYEALCRSRLGRNDLLVGVILYVALVLFTLLFCNVFSGRGAFIQIGALIGTIMVASVFVTIIPNQRKTVAALIAGEKPDPIWGKQAKQRSLHNNYLTLPVVFLMLANHYPLLFGTRYNWLIVAIVLLMGPLIRHFFNSRHAGTGSPWWTWAVAAAGLVAIGWLSAQGPRAARAADARPSAPVAFAQAEEVVLARCSMCHAVEPAWDGIAAPPRGVVLDNAADIARQARTIALQAVHSAAMPPGNVTEITAEERAILAAWTAAGAPTR